MAVRHGGVSAAWFLLRKEWGLPYPETTGYIIRTMIRASEFTGSSVYVERARRMGDYLISLQENDGGYRNATEAKISAPVIFNTGQIIIGMCILSNYLNDMRYLDSAYCAGKWLTNLLDSDGAWRRSTHQGPKAYHARVAWSLAMLAHHLEDHKFISTAERSLHWIMGNLRKDFWFDNMGLEGPIQPAYLHSIAYTYRGIFECAMLGCGDVENSLKVVWSFLEKMNQLAVVRKGCLPGAFSEGWIPDDSYSCLTGNAQTVVLMQRYAILCGVKPYSVAIRAMLDYLKRAQATVTQTGINECHGGLPGSWPLKGKYCPYMIPNWAAKFFADSLLIHLAGEDVISRFSKGITKR